MATTRLSSDTFIFTIGRMNPPTPGHLKLIQTLMITAVILNIPEVFVYLSTSTKDNDNPIICEHKLDVFGRTDEAYVDGVTTLINSTKHIMVTSPLEEWITDFTDILLLRDAQANWASNLDEYNRRLIELQVHTICAQVPFVTAVEVVKSNLANLINIIYFFGNEPDKVVMNNNLYESFTKKGYRQNYTGIALERVDMTETKGKTPDELEEQIMTNTLPREAISASLVRKLVINDKETAFFQLYRPYLEESKIHILFRQIHEGVHREVVPTTTASRQRKTANNKGRGKRRRRRTTRKHMRPY